MYETSGEFPVRNDVYDLYELFANSVFFNRPARDFFYAVLAVFSQ